MCVVSMVHDYYLDQFKPVFHEPPVDWSKWVQSQIRQPTVDLKELARLIAEFKYAVEAAKTVDKLTMQPDCVDPEKAKLQARVAELEKRLADIAEAAAK